MNFSRNTSNFFRGKTMKNFMNNKLSCSFFTYNMNKVSSKNFVMFSNAFFLNSMQKNIILNKSLSSAQISKLMIGEASLGENLENSSSGINENLSDGNFISEFLITNNSKKLIPTVIALSQYAFHFKLLLPTNMKSAGILLFGYMPSQSLRQNLTI